MSATYEGFVISLTNLQQRLSQHQLSFDSFYQYLPPQVFEQLWIRPLESNAFRSALPIIYKSVEDWVRSNSQNSQAVEIQTKIGYILDAIAPFLITYKSNGLEIQEIAARVKELKNAWNFQPEICAHLIAHYDNIDEQKCKCPQPRKQQLIKQFLEVFNTNQDTLTYKSYGIQLLSQSIGQTIFHIKEIQQNYENVYNKLCVRNREKIISFFSKIKNKKATCVSILEWIVDLQRNLTKHQKIANICMLFLISENWDKFEESESRLKDPAVVDIFAMAFERLMYHTYNDDQSIVQIFLQFLQAAKITLYDQIKKAIGYHLIALYELHNKMQKTSTTYLIQSIWNGKMNGVMLGDLYIKYLPSFTQRAKREDEFLIYSSKKSQPKSKSSGKSSMFRPNPYEQCKELSKKIQILKDELRKSNFQKVYLLVDCINLFYLQISETKHELNKLSRNLIISMLALLIKKIQSKLSFRSNSTLLKKCISLKAMQLMETCFDEGCQLEQNSQINSLFECCYLKSEKMINFEKLMQFHERNNQDNLETVFNLKQLCYKLNTDPDYYASEHEQYQEKLLQTECLEKKIYNLYKNDKKFEMKLVVILRLLLIKSRNITNNLLINYVYYLLEQKPEMQFKNEQDSVSQMINQEIENGKDQENKKLFMKMGYIFQQFDDKLNQHKILRVLKGSTQNKYFNFLRKREHEKYYMSYSKIYLKMNYLKESLYFLQMHSFNTKDIGKEMKCNAIGIYERLNMPFKTYLASILSQLKIDPNTYHSFGLKKAVMFDFQNILSNLMKKIHQESLRLSQQDFLYVNDRPRVEVWLSMFYPFLQLFFQEINTYIEPEQISQSLKKTNIILKYITLKLQLLHYPQKILSEDSLSKFTSCIQLLRDPQDRVLFYQQFVIILQDIKDIDINNLQTTYLDDMLQSKSYQKLLKYLRKDLKEDQPDANMQAKYLKFYIKYLFHEHDYMKCLAMIEFLQKDQQLSKSAQILKINLECRKILFQLPLEDSLRFISICIDSSHHQPSSKKAQYNFKQYFKIFRKFFNRYNFGNVKHNRHFLKVYKQFYDKFKQIQSDNKEFFNEAIYFLLRFVFEKFFFENQKVFGEIVSEVMAMFEQKLLYFVPFCDYLIKRISTNAAKNNTIKFVLRTVITNHPSDCIWIISFLKNFTVKSPENSRLSYDEKNEIEILEELSSQVLDILQEKKMLNKQHLDWIDSLVMLSLSETEITWQRLFDFANTQIPPDLKFMFNHDFQFKRIQGIRPLSNGKSAPLLISFRLKNIHHNNRQQTVLVIFKGNIETKNYRNQSNTANFFSQTGIFDHDITYKVIHLSKYLISIEYRDNCGTIYSIIKEKLRPQLDQLEMAIKRDLGNRRFLSQQKRLLDIYNRNRTQIRFSDIIYFQAQNIMDWWKRYSNFVRSLAQWSFVGYVVGLGDRHCDNILMTKDGKLIHIDFQYVLDIGLNLECPEWVPFRLTGVFVQPLGILGPYGMFYAEMIKTIRDFQEREDNTWKALSNFIRPNDTKICEEIINRSRFATFKQKNIEEAVGKLIFRAMDPQLLRLMFYGWKAYL